MAYSWSYKGSRGKMVKRPGLLSHRSLAEHPIPALGPAAQWIGFAIGVVGFLFAIVSFFIAQRSDPSKAVNEVFIVSISTILMMSLLLALCIYYLIRQDAYVRRSLVKDTKRLQIMATLSASERELQSNIMVLEKTIKEEKAKDLANANDLAQFVAVHFQEITRVTRDLITSAIHISISKDASEVAFLRNDTSNAINHVGRAFAELMTKTTGFICSTSTKTFVPAEEGNGTYFITIQRHCLEHPLRAERDKDLEGDHKRHDISSNIAFLNISRAVEDYFLFNPEDVSHIKKLISFHNDDWNKFYNSCLVVPISGPSQVFSDSSRKRRNGDIIVGFLCTDNFGGGFRTEYELRIAWQISHYMFILIEVLFYLDRIEELNRIKGSI